MRLIRHIALLLAAVLAVHSYAQVTTNGNITGVVLSNNVNVTGGTVSGVTQTATVSPLGIRSSGAAFDLQLGSSEAITANRLLSFVLNDSARTLTIPGSTTVPIASQALTFSGMTAPRTITIPDASFTVARIDAANTFTGHQTIEGVTATGATGTGLMVFGTSPTLTTPTLGVATATSINGNIFTAGTYTLTGAAAKTLTFNNSLTLAGTDSTTMTFPSTSATIARTDAAQTLSAVQTISTGATAQALNITSTAATGTYFTVQNSGTSFGLIGDSGTLDSGTVGNLAMRSAGTYVSLDVGGTSYAKVTNAGVVSTGLAATYLNNTSAAYTVLTTDYTITNNVAGTVTLTLPAPASFVGRILVLRTVTANTVVSASSNVVPLAGGAAGTAILAATAGKYAQIQSDGTNWQIVMAN